MRVVQNFGSHWGILASDDEGDEKQDEQPEQQPQPRPRRRNVRGRGERGQPVHQQAPIGGPNFRGDMTGYFDQLSFSVNWIGGIMENMI